MSPQMKKRFLLGFGFFVLALSVVLVVWQGSFSMGEFGPVNPQQTFIFWAVTTLIFVLMVTLGFILFRELLKLYVARQANQLGSRIRTKLVLGALALSCIPVFCLVLFSLEVLSRSVDRWFTAPINNQVELFTGIAAGLQSELQNKVNAQASLLAMQPEVRRILGGAPAAGFLEQFAKDQEAVSAGIYPVQGRALDSWMGDPSLANDNQAVHARYPVQEGGRTLGYVELTSHLPIDLQEQKNMIGKYNN